MFDLLYSIKALLKLHLHTILIILILLESMYFSNRYIPGNSIIIITFDKNYYIIINCTSIIIFDRFLKMSKYNYSSNKL